MHHGLTLTPALSLREGEKGSPSADLRLRGKAGLCTIRPLSLRERVRVRV